MTDKKKPRSKLTPIADGRGHKITAETPLTPIQLQFIRNFIKCGNMSQAIKDTGIEKRTNEQYSDVARRFLSLPNVQAEIARIMEEIRKETVATAEEVMTYFTSVMRGEVKDQFGLEAPLSERTRAAQELAKRTIDIQNRKEGNADQLVSIKLDWSRDK